MQYDSFGDFCLLSLAFSVLLLIFELYKTAFACLLKLEIGTKWTKRLNRFQLYQITLKSDQDRVCTNRIKIQLASCYNSAFALYKVSLHW